MNRIEIKAKIADLNLVTKIVMSNCHVLSKLTESNKELNGIIEDTLRKVEIVQSEIKELTEMVDK